MLLPSDIARLVLGYLQQEKLHSTCSAFIAESPDLKEYAEHYTDEGFVPGCLLSLFGKNLTAILNEYVSMKAKEMSHEVPAMMSSLWKKLEYTLSQIRSMQNSAAFATHQRESIYYEGMEPLIFLLPSARTRSAIADMRRQNTLKSPSTSSSKVSASHESGQQTFKPLSNTQVDFQCIPMQAKANPLFISLSETQENRPTTNNGGNSTPAVVSGSKNRKHSNLLSPGRRKSESQKRRPCSTGENLHSASVAAVEEKSDPLQELIDGDFPKMVIENARERFLSNKSLQEKLAENINKFLGSDANAAQTSKQPDSCSVEADTSIDEILALEGGEIHMSEEAIQDILQQTESDPAFQALFDLFDYGKRKDDKKTMQDSSSQNEDVVKEVIWGGKNPHTLENSIGIEDGKRNGTNASKNSSTQNEDVLKNVTVADTNPDTFRNSLEIQDGDSHRESASSASYHSGIICSSGRKQQKDNNRVEDEENGTQTTLGLHMEKEPEKSSSGLPPVRNSKQICEVQAAITLEHDMSEPNQQQSPQDGSHSTVSNSNPVSLMLVTESNTTMETEKELTMEMEKESPFSDLPANEQNVLALGVNNSDLPEHSLVTTNVEMEDVSSSKGSKPGMECEPDILNITPLSEDAYANPFVAVPLKLFRNNDHSNFNKDSTATNLSSDSSKNLQDVADIAPTLPHSFEVVSDNHIDTPMYSSGSVESALLKEASPQHRSEEKKQEVTNESEPLAAQEALVKYVDPHAKVTALTAMPQEPLPSAEANTNTEHLPHATSTMEEGNMVTSTQSSTIASASSSHVVPLPENAFTIIDSSSVPTGVGNVPSSSSQSLDVDPSSIMSLKIIISDEASRSGDTEINNAVSSISGETLPTIILSSPGKIQLQNIGLPQNASAEEPVTSSERVADVVFVDQSLPVHTLNDPASSTVSFQVEDGTVFSVAGTPNISKEGGFIQLMPTTSAAFGQSNNLYITTCMPDTASFRNNASQSKITPIAAKTQSQSQTPPRPMNMFAVGQTLSPKVSQGSTIIFASPVQPAMLQMGMIPVSVVGQSRNTFSTFPSPLLRMPATAPLGSRGIPKLPIQPKTQKSIGAKSTIHTGRMLKRKGDVPNQSPIVQPQRLEPSETIVITDAQRKPEEKSFLVPPSVSSSNSKVVGSHRRVLCFEDCATSTSDGESSRVTHTPTTSHSKERADSLLHSLQAAVGASQYFKIMQSNDSSKTESNTPSDASIASQSELTSPRVSSVAAESGQRVALLGYLPDFLYKTSANKENELKRCTEQEKKQEAAKLLTSPEHVAFCYEKTVPLVQEMSRKGTLPNILRKSPHDARKEPAKSHLISPLSKQTGEMLQDIQLSSPPAKQADTGDLPIPRTPGSGMGDDHTDTFDSIRTPTCKSSLKVEGTPKALLPPATPELPGCSPASEAGSENSVSMAAHTLMILSRASVARPGSTTPLKDNTQQIKSSKSTAKKRKQEEMEECERQTRSSKKDMQSPPTPLKKKKIKKQKKKKLLDSFPAGMDVDKFLLSLHYDE